MQAGEGGYNTFPFFINFSCEFVNVCSLPLLLIRKPLVRGQKLRSESSDVQLHITMPELLGICFDTKVYFVIFFCSWKVSAPAIFVKGRLGGGCQMHPTCE